MGIHAGHGAPAASSRRRPQGSRGFAAAAIGLFFMAMAAAVCGCGQREALVGKYEAVSQTALGQVALTLELHADGKGFWSVETDNAPFRWDLYKNNIRLHTPTGGVIQGIVDRDSLQITMPGQGVMQFTKVR